MWYEGHCTLPDHPIPNKNRVNHTTLDMMCEYVLMKYRLAVMCVVSNSALLFLRWTYMTRLCLCACLCLGHRLAKEHDLSVRISAMGVSLSSHNKQAKDHSKSQISCSVHVIWPLCFCWFVGLRQGKTRMRK